MILLCRNFATIPGMLKKEGLKSLGVFLFLFFSQIGFVSFLLFLPYIKRTCITVTVDRLRHPQEMLARTPIHTQEQRYYSPVDQSSFAEPYQNLEPLASSREAASRKLPTRYPQYEEL